MARRLNVFLHHDHVGELLQDDSGQFSFTYSKEWLNKAGATALSHSLSLRTEPFNGKECRGFFSGILPEDQKRRTLADFLGISPRNDFAMLERIGGECAGAITFLLPGEKPLKTGFKYRRLSDAELADVLRMLPRHPLMTGDRGVRLSLAGAQDKLAVMVKGSEIFIPLFGAPSTHILKPAIEHFEGLVHNEAACLQLAASLNIPAAAASTHVIDEIDYLLVSRYDRVIGANGNIRRVHQEDFCQALGVVPEMKYQNEGGPSLKQCFDLVRAASAKPALDLKALLDSVIFNFLIENNDAHAKNFSLLYLDDGVRMAPLYDLVCTAYYSNLSPNMAMKIGGKYESDKVLPRHFEQLAKEIGFAAPIVLERVADLTAVMLDALDRMQTTNAVTQKVLTIIGKRCDRVLQNIF